MLGIRFTVSQETPFSLKELLVVTVPQGTYTVLLNGSHALFLLFSSYLDTIIRKYVRTYRYVYISYCFIDRSFFDRYTRYRVRSCPRTLLIFGMIIELETKRYIFGGDVIFERSKFGLLNNVQYWLFGEHFHVCVLCVSNVNFSNVERTNRDWNYKLKSRYY